MLRVEVKQIKTYVAIKFYRGKARIKVCIAPIFTNIVYFPVINEKLCNLEGLVDWGESIHAVNSSEIGNLRGIIKRAALFCKQCTLYYFCKRCGLANKICFFTLTG